MSQRVILVNPPQRGLLEGFSSSLLTLADYLARHAPEVRVSILDLGLSSEDSIADDVRRRLGDCSGRPVIGITATTASYQMALAVAREVRHVARDCVLVMGGHHASADADVVLESHAYIDAVVMGEGEVALLELARRAPDLSAVPNLAYRDGHEVRRTWQAPLLDQAALDHICHAVDKDAVESAPGKFDHITYVSARGCPLKCSFCAVANQRIRAKSIGAIVKDLRCLIEDRGYQRIALEDNFFAHSPARTLQLCAALTELRREVSFSWDCQTRVESMMRSDVIAAMASAGCEAVYLGVEALSPRLLSALGKTSRPQAYLRMLKSSVVPGILDSGMDCYINIQFGIAGETGAERAEALGELRLIGETARVRNRSVTVFPQLAVVYPGTIQYVERLNTGAYGSLGRLVFEHFTKWEQQQEPVRRWLGQTFAHGTGGIPEGILDAGLMSRGRFEIDPGAVETVKRQLDSVRALPGIRVFEYGAFLAPRVEGQASARVCA